MTSTRPETAKPKAERSAGGPAPAEQPPLDARALLAGRREVPIALDGEIYRLRLTAQDKLILTK